MWAGRELQNLEAKREKDLRTLARREIEQSNVASLWDRRTKPTQRDRTGERRRFQYPCDEPINVFLKYNENSENNAIIKTQQSSLGTDEAGDGLGKYLTEGARQQAHFQTENNKLFQSDINVLLPLSALRK